MLISSSKNQNGVSLLEILVTIMVLSIGLLGIAGLQITSLKNTQRALLKTHVSLLVYDLTDIIRSNPDQVSKNFFDNIDTQSKTFNSLPNCKLKEGCNSEDMANTEMKDWVDRMKDLLPEGNAAIIGDGAGNFSLNISWLDDVSRQSKEAGMSFKTTTFRVQ